MGRSSRHGQGGGIHDQVGEPQTHSALVAENALEGRLHRFKIEKRLVDIKDNQGKNGHVMALLLLHFIWSSSACQCRLLSRLRCAACLARLPQIAMLHHLLARLRVRSTKTTLHPFPPHPSHPPQPSPHP